VANDRIVIPVGSYVQGVIDSVQRAGRVKGRAEVLVHFRTLILPSGYTVALPGAVDSAPDLDTGKVKGKDPESEGKIQHEGEKGKDAGTIATTAGIGAGIGAAARGVKGAGIGAGLGAAGGLIGTLLTRGSDLRLEPGSTVDIVLERPITLDEAKLHASR
jgi:type IV secretion system protein VirB10